MTLVLDIVTKAFRKVGISAEGEALNADAIAEGVGALNDMMHAWALRGVDIEHADVAAPDTFPLAAKFNEGTVYLLAERLSPNYSIPRSFDADDWFRTIQAAYAPTRVVTVPPSLLNTPTGRRRGAYS